MVNMFLLYKIQNVLHIPKNKPKVAGPLLEAAFDKDTFSQIHVFLHKKK